MQIFQESSPIVYSNYGDSFEQEYGTVDYTLHTRNIPISTNRHAHNVLTS